MAFPALQPSRRERASDATRARIFEAALAEFRDAGVDRASIARICREAGVSRPTFYSHFPTKAHVLLELQYSVQVGLAERLKRCRSLRDAFAEVVNSLLEAEQSVGSAELFRAMLTSALGDSASPSDPDAFPSLAELARHFEDGSARGELRPGIDPQRASLLCLVSVFGVQMAGAPSEREADFDQLFSLYLAEDSP